MAYETLGDFTLANEETAELGVMTAPCLPWKERLCWFLNSPPQPERASPYGAVMPSRGHVRTFLRGADSDAAAFVHDRGFRLETSLCDDFNHHDPTTPDMRVYGRSLPGALWALRGDQQGGRIWWKREGARSRERSPWSW